MVWSFCNRFFTNTYGPSRVILFSLKYIEGIEWTGGSYGLVYPAGGHELYPFPFASRLTIFDPILTHVGVSKGSRLEGAEYVKHLLQLVGNVSQILGQRDLSGYIMKVSTYSVQMCDRWCKL